MSPVSNLLGTISPIQLGNPIQKVAGNVDNSDETFSNILNEKINGMDNFMNSNGVNILDFQNSNTNNIRTNNSVDVNQIGDMTTSEVVTFTKSLFDSSDLTNGRGPVYNFSRKSATDFYNKYSKNIAMNLEEFVEDALHK